MKNKVALITIFAIGIFMFSLFIGYKDSNNKKVVEKEENSNVIIYSNNNISNEQQTSNIISNSNIASNSNIIVKSNINSNKESNSNMKSNVVSNKVSNVVTSNKPKPNPKPSTSNVVKPLSVTEKVENDLKNMTLEQKIGQMLIISVNGTYMDNTMKNTLTQYKPGGVILFGYNLGNYKTTIKMIDDIKSTSSIPMIVSIDQEGGKVQRLTSITGKAATNIPSMKRVGAMGNNSLAYNIGTVIGEELSVFGINMDFAPVIDINGVTNSFMGDRSLGNNPNLVATLGNNIGKGIESKGVTAVYKHFPGHGSTVTDSHYALPVLEKTKEELYNSDLIPFKYAIDNKAKVIMIGHLAAPNLTNDNTPASLSKTVITGILKQELGYKGLVITDALNMGALTTGYSEKQIYEKAINAGVDILLMPKSPSSAITNIKQSIKEGKIKESQIDNSVRKILTFKYINIKNNKLSTNYLGSQAHLNIVNQVK